MKKNLLKIVAFTALLALSGCATVDADNANDVTGKTQIKHDDFTKETKFTGPEIFGTYQKPGVRFIRAWKKDSGDTVYQIYIDSHYRGGWRFYAAAFDSDGTKLSITPISKEVGFCDASSGCSYDEIVGINISREYLENLQQKGITLKLIGKGGEEIYSIPAGYIQGFLNAVK